MNMHDGAANAASPNSSPCRCAHRDRPREPYRPLPLTLNGKTLTFKSPKATGQGAMHLPFRNVQGNGPGTLVISDYVRLYPKNKASTLSEVTLVIDTLGQYLSANDESSITVSNLVYRSNTQVSRSYHAITVLGSYAPESSTYAPMVQLADAVGRLTVESDGVYRPTGLVIIVK